MMVLQIVVISIVLFFLYKFLLGTIGVEQFGIWSLVLATTAVTQIADLGFSGGVVKFVSKYVALKEKKKCLGNHSNRCYNNRYHGRFDSDHFLSPD